LSHSARIVALSRVPVNLFSIPFGICGLAAVWRFMAAGFDTPIAIGDALFVVAALVWILLLVGVAARFRAAPGELMTEVRDPVLSPFFSLPAIVGMLLAIGLEPHAYGLAKVLFLVFFAAAMLFGGWISGDWIVEKLDPGRFHPGYFLPTVAAGLIGGEGCAIFGLTGLGWLSFGIGLICWLVLGSLIMNRLFFFPMLPTPLIPTLAIELAPAAVGGVAYFQLTDGRIDTFAYVLAGYAGLMVLVQARLLPLFLRLGFGPGFWAFTFSWCATAAFAVRWLALERPDHATLYAALIAAAASILVGAIGLRSLLLVARGQFLPPPPTPAAGGTLSEPVATPAPLAQPGRAPDL
jgi:tellurite resistance protein